MIISKEQTEQLIEEYEVYIHKIIQHTYFYTKPETKDELHQVGLIGLWKGIIAYYKKEPTEFDQKEFVDTICAYIRYEMADLFSTFSIVRISRKQWRNFIKMKQIINANHSASEKELIYIASKAGIRYDWYLKVNEFMKFYSLDSAAGENGEMDIYNVFPYYDGDITRYMDQVYIDYIINAAFAGIKNRRDKKLLQTWMDSVYNGMEMKQTELGRIYGLSPSMVGVIVNRFVDICRFVRNCEQKFSSNSNGLIYFPEIAEKSKTYNGKKIPGVKWILRNRKWRVEITIGKNNSVFIGYFENYEDAVKARHEAEMKYRGKSEIKL